MFVGMNIGINRSGGGGGGFSPKNIAGLQLWLDATKGVKDASGNAITADGGVVATWEDQSGRNAHAVQSNAAKRPVLRVGANGKNNKPTVEFTAANLTSLTTSNISITELSVFVVFTSNAPSSESVIYYAENAGDGAWMIRTTDDALGPKYTITHRLANIFKNNYRMYIPGNGANGNPAEAGWNMFAQKSDGTNRKDQSIWVGHQLFSRGRWCFIRDSLQGATSGQLINAPVSIGATPSGGSPLTGKIAELLIYSSDLEQGDHEAIEGYLSEKWAISLNR